jgi:2-polyprenyl-6-methoxyphenol hydroxylase-like FAD-dependent oxidoreductase
MGNPSTDIVVVGAGIAGSAAAAVLGRQGRRVVLVDPRPSCPHVFKAEKIDREQVRLLRQFGLLEAMLPYAGEVRQVRVASEGRVFRTVAIEQYGISYPDMVNALRARLPESVEFRLAHVEAVANSDGIQRVRVTGGQEIESRLVVLASGASTRLLAQLGLQRRLHQPDQSQVFGFTIFASGAQGFDFDAITYYSFERWKRVDYLTLFKFRDSMRANLFVFRAPGDPWVRSFLQGPDRMMHEYMPKLERVTGKYRVMGKVEFGRADLYRVEGNPRPGVVLIGDAFQSVCPSTGMGLEKVLTDVEALAECVPRWWATPGMGVDKLTEFYSHPRKAACDARALRNARRFRQAAMDPSPRWRVYRFLLHLKSA